jgi:hypothetical protein
MSMIRSSRFDDDIESVTHATHVCEKGYFHGRPVQHGNPSTTDAKAGHVYVFDASDDPDSAHDETWFPLGWEHGFKVFISYAGDLMKKVASLQHIQTKLRVVYCFLPAQVP